MELGTQSDSALHQRTAPTFVLGMNGSGTTMLADCLGQHSALYAFPYETKVLPYFWVNRARFGDLRSLAARRTLARAIGGTKEFWQANAQQPLVLDDQELFEPGFDGVVNALFRRLAASTGKLRWVEKSPQNLGYARELAEAFPSARFVHIIRDGRDCAQSLHRRWRFDPVVSIYRWRNLVRIGRETGHALGPTRYMELRYEVLTADPESEMRRICMFLELDYESRMLTSSMRTADPRIASCSAIMVNSRKWRSYFDANTVNLMERTSGAFLQALGYPVECAGTSSPSRVRFFISRFRGRAHAVINRIREHGISAIPVLLRAARTSRMQDEVDRSR